MRANESQGYKTQEIFEPLEFRDEIFVGKKVRKAPRFMWIKDDVNSPILDGTVVKVLENYYIVEYSSGVRECYKFYDRGRM